MLVKLKNTNIVGNIDDREYDPNIYEQVQSPQVQQQVQQQPQGQSSGNTVLDKILGFAGKTADFLAPVTTQRFKTAFGGIDEGKRIMADTSLSDEEKKKKIAELFQSKSGELEKSKLKSGLELGSFLIPFGKGGSALTKTVLPALAVYGAQQVAQDKPLTLEGAGISVATAGILNKILGLGGKTQKIGETAVESVLNPQAKADPFYERTRQQLTKVAEDVGLKGSASDQLKQLPSIFEGIGTKIKSMLGKTKVTNTEVIDNFTNKLAETTDYIPTDKKWAAVRKFFTDKVKKLGGEFGDDAVYNLKQEIADNMGNVFKKIDKGTLLSPKEQAYKAMFDSLKDVLDTKVPEIRNLNLLQHQLFELAPGLVKKSEEKVIAPIIGQLQGIPGLREGLQRITDTTGRTLQTAGGLVDTLTKPLQTSAGQNILNQTLQQTLGSTFPSETPQTPANPETSVPSAETTPEEIFSPQKQWKWDAKAQDWVPNTQAKSETSMKGIKDLFPVLMIQDLQKTGGKNIPELKSIMDALGAGSKLSAAEQTAVDQATSGLSLVDTLNEQYKKVQAKGLTAKTSGLGRLGGIKGAIASASQSDPDAAAYEKTKKAFLSKLSRATGEKGVLTDKDIDRIESALPSFYDTPETAQQSIDLVKQIIGDAIKAKQGSTGEDNLLMQILGGQL